MASCVAPAFTPSIRSTAASHARGIDMLIVIYLVTITVEAMSGALAAGRRNMDIFGVAVIAFVFEPRCQ